MLKFFSLLVTVSAVLWDRVQDSKMTLDLTQDITYPRNSGYITMWRQSTSGEEATQSELINEF